MGIGWEYLRLIQGTGTPPAVTVLATKLSADQPLGGSVYLLSLLSNTGYEAYFRGTRGYELDLE